jgi:proliferating cell nuclear antigen
MEPDLFKKIIIFLKKNLDIAQFMLTQTGMTLNAIDPTHVMNITARFDKEFFTEYDFVRESILRVNLAALTKILARNLGDTIYLFPDSKENTLIIQFNTEKKKRNFHLKLLTDLEAVPQTPSLNFDAKCQITTAALIQLIKDSYSAGDYLMLTLDSQMLEAYTAGSDYDTTIEFSEFLEKPTTLGKQTATYSLEFLASLVLIEKIVDQVTLQFSEDKPLNLTFNLECGVIEIYLAPRIEEEEEKPEPKKKKGEVDWELPKDESENKDDEDESQDEEIDTEGEEDKEDREIDE